MALVQSGANRLQTQLRHAVCALFQLEVARTHVDYHMKEFGYKKSNVNFVQGYIEALTEAGLEKNSFDIIM